LISWGNKNDVKSTKINQRVFRTDREVKEMNPQKLMKLGRLSGKKAEFAQVSNDIKAKMDYMGFLILPEMDIEIQKFDMAQTTINELVSLKNKYTNLKKEIKDLEESL
jgi:hypothetical protein